MLIICEKVVDGIEVRRVDEHEGGSYGSLERY